MISPDIGEQGRRHSTRAFDGQRRCSQYRVGGDSFDRTILEHVDEWLAGAGEGAQVIIVDNTPPENVIDHIVMRYTRDPETPPLGVIDNETGGPW